MLRRISSSDDSDIVPQVARRQSHHFKASFGNGVEIRLGDHWCNGVTFRIVEEAISRDKQDAIEWCMDERNRRCVAGTKEWFSILGSCEVVNLIVVDYPSTRIANACTSNSIGPNINDDCGRFSHRYSVVDLSKYVCPLIRGMNRRKCGFDFADDGFSGHVSGANATSTIGDDDYGTIIVCDDSNTVFAPIAIRFGRSDCLNIWHVAVVREPDNGDGG